MGTRDFKVGDTVRIRSWEDMEKEFGIKYGTIQCEFEFVEAMRKHCGKILNITSIEDGYIRFAEDVGAWNYSTDMIELIVSKEQTPEDTSSREYLLSKAKEIITTDRNLTYGKPENSFSVIADLWEVYVREKCLKDGKITLTAEDATMMMVLFKVARTITGKPNPDNYIDMAGYAGCAGEIALNKKV